MGRGRDGVSTVETRVDGEEVKKAAQRGAVSFGSTGRWVGAGTGERTVLGRYAFRAVCSLLLSLDQKMAMKQTCDASAAIGGQCCACSALLLGGILLAVLRIRRRRPAAYGPTSMAQPPIPNGAHCGHQWQLQSRWNQTTESNKQGNRDII